MRKSLNISQEDLGKQLGIPQSTISRIENGTMDPPYSKFKLIFEFLENLSMKRKKSETTAADIMTDKIRSIKSDSKVKETIDIMSEFSISQLPIIENNQNLGSVTSKKIQKLITDNPDIINLDVMKIKELPFPEVEKNWNVKDISNLLVNYPAVLVKEFDKYIGIITDSDFLKLSSRY
ncbi:MAG: CBS domain-containing protein [Candidatus Hodarchaeota archaeon]